MTPAIYIPTPPPKAAQRLAGQFDRIAALLGLQATATIPEPHTAAATLATEDARRHGSRLLVGALALVDLAEHEATMAVRQHITPQAEGFGRMALRVIRGGRA